MKTSIIASAMILALAAAGQASANTGTITFSGTISEVTCTVTGGDNSTGSGGNLTVNLAQANGSELANPGDRAGYSEFSITIGGPSQPGCENGKTASLGWDVSGSSINANGQLTNNASTDPAAGVAVVLKDSGGNDINLNSTATLPGTVIVDNTAVLTFAAEYVRLTEAVAEGNFSSTLRYAIVYN